MHIISLARTSAIAPFHLGVQKETDAEPATVENDSAIGMPTRHQENHNGQLSGVRQRTNPSIQAQRDRGESVSDDDFPQTLSL